MLQIFELRVSSAKKSVPGIGVCLCGKVMSVSVGLGGVGRQIFHRNLESQKSYQTIIVLHKRLQENNYVIFYSIYNAVLYPLY